MKQLFFLACWLVTVTVAQGQDISVKTFLHLKAMNRAHGQAWLNRHHFTLLKHEQSQGVDRQTYLGEQIDAAGDRDALFVVYGHEASSAQYISYSTNAVRFTYFRRNLPAYQFQQVDAYQDTHGNQVIQYQHAGDVIELTTLWSSQVKGNLYTISLVPATLVRKSVR